MKSAESIPQGAKQAAEKLCFVSRHDFSRVPMSLRLTQGDENHGESYFSTQVSMGRGCCGTGAIEAVVVSDPEHAFEPMSVRRCGNAKTVRDCA